ncbi:hypothetical protein [Tetragenococcus halophilus]|uniref:hypothetical protein n=1 Tax=Tetragenococcus halophilus TaxID=51669 RepID=UPI00209AD053|nr:hypothetical protein [Tetragenococcus halophilus]MCO8286693.1 hypothetical protein [Tetragenococcus halophilus]
MNDVIQTLLDSGLGQILTFLGIVVSAWQGPKVVAKIQGENKIDEIKTEGDSKAEELYVNHISEVIKEYRDQVQGFKEELAKVRQEFADFREEHEKEVKAYKQQISFLEIEIETKDNRILELEEENENMKIEIHKLRGGG